MRLAGGKHAVKHLVPGAQLLVERIRKQIHAGIAQRAAVDLNRIAHNYQSAWIFYRQHFEQYGINQAEDGCIGANTQSQCEHRDRSEGRAYTSTPPSAARVL